MSGSQDQKNAVNNAQGNEGQRLLSAILSFIQPIIQDWASEVTEEGYHKDVMTDSDESGRNLLTALRQFVRASGQSQHTAQAKFSTDQEERKKIEHQQNDPSYINSDINNMDRHRWYLSDLCIQELLSDAVDNAVEESEIRYRLPKRLLAFDSKGTGIKLMDKNQVIEALKRSVHKEAELLCVDAWERMRDGHEDSEGDSSIFEIPLWDLDDRILELVNQQGRYAILSHTWIKHSPGEVLFSDWSDRRSEKHESWAKIAGFCRIAASEHGVSLGWVDNVCIDKNSSAELDESIRSMYTWYRNAHVCIVYLSSVETFDQIRHARWFKRGWTLQELLAPKDIQFRDANWNNVLDWDISVESDILLEELPYFPSSARVILQTIWEKSGVSEREVMLFKRGQNDKVPVSRILDMSWGRNVSIPEDNIYSLMGLLGVSMNVAYGEGVDQALYRLLEQLLNRRKNILDIFNRSFRRGDTLLSKSNLEYFWRSTTFDLQGKSSLDSWRPVKPIILTHLGVRVPLLLIPGYKCEVDEELKVEPVLGLRSTIYRGFAHLGSHLSKYSLIDSRIPLGKAPLHADPDSPDPPVVITMGVLNFTITNEHVLLPSEGLSVPLHFRQSIPGNVRQGDAVMIMDSLRAPELRIFSYTRRNILRGTPDRRVAPIPIRDLQQHGGMQILTLYL